MLRLAIVGCGNHSEGNHARPLQYYTREHRGRLRLVAACDLRRDRAEYYCERYGFERAYQDMDVMLREENPDAVVCVMPQSRIVPMGIRLLEAGIPCQIEKPLGISREETVRLVQVAETTGTPHQVSVNRRFAPLLNRGFVWACDQGPLRYMRGSIFRNQRSEPTFVWETGIHVTDTLCYLGGHVSEHQIRRLHGKGITADWFLLSLQFEQGYLGEVEILPTNGMQAEEYELFGDGYRVHVVMPVGNRSDEAILRCWRDGSCVLQDTGFADQPLWLSNGAYAEVEAFVNLLESGISTGATIPNVARSMQIVWDAASV